MDDFTIYAKTLLDTYDTACKVVEGNREDDADRGDIITPDKFSRGYALGYAHALSGAYEALPDWVRDNL